MMKLIKRSAIIFNSWLFFCVLFSYPLALMAADAPIHIEANSMTSTEKTNSVVFTGEVDARQADVRIRTDEMTVFYTAPKEDETDKDTEKTAAQQVEKLVCLGNVEITKGEWLGTSQKMTYLSKERQVILTGDAKAWQNQNMVSGEKIIYYLDEGRSEVSGDRPAMTTDGTAAGEKKPSRVNMTIRQK
jgi:lipopolysaccharide export system protein LptA